MVVKILKEGSQSLIHPTRRFVCRKCKCEFTAQEVDFNKVVQGDRPWDSDSKYMVCPTPQCGESVYWMHHADKGVDPY